MDRTRRKRKPLVDVVRNNIEQILSERKIMKKDLATLLGYTRSDISQKLSGRHGLRLETVDEIAKVLNVDPAWLFIDHSS